MPTRSDVVEERMRDLGNDLTALWAALVRDPKRQARREQFWRAFSKASIVAGTMMARKMAGRTWRILTGEGPPATQK